MTHTTLPTVRRIASRVLAATAIAAGLLASTSSMANQGYDKRLDALVVHVKAEPDYKPLPLFDGKDRMWFYNLTESLYDGKITKEQYVAAGLKEYPGYEASFNEIADFMLTK